MAIELQTPVITGTQRSAGRQKAQEIADSNTAEPNAAFKKYFGGIWVRVVNKTQYNLSYMPGDLNYGEMINGPPDADAWTARGFGLGANTFLAVGVRPKGGIQMRLKLDDGHNFDFTLGLSSAMYGCYRASLVNGHDRGAAVNALSTGGARITSEKYEGVIKGDIKHTKTQFNINVITTPGYDMSMVISQDE